MEGLNMKQMIVCKALLDREKQKEINKFEEYFEYEFDQELGFMIHYYDLQCSINLEDFFKYIKNGYIIISLGQALILALKLCQHLIEIHQKQITLGKISNQHIWINLEGISKRIQCSSFQQMYFRVQFVNFQNDFTKDEDFNHFKTIIFEIFYSLQKQHQQLNGYQDNVKLASGLLETIKRKSDLLALFEELKQLNLLVNQQNQLHKNELIPITSTTTLKIHQYLKENIQQINIQESQTFTYKYLKCLMQKIKSQLLIDQMKSAYKKNDGKDLKKTEFDLFNNLLSYYQSIFNSLENNQQFTNWFESLQDKIKNEYEQQFKLPLALDQVNLNKFKVHYLKFQIYTVASQLKTDNLRESPKLFLQDIEKIQNETVNPFVEQIYREKIKEELAYQILVLIADLI